MGSSTVTRQLIITCDEFGETHSANLAIFAAVEHGLRARCPIGATLQTPGPWAREAADFAVMHPEADVGIHLTIECGPRGARFRPLCARTEVPGLYGPDGHMWATAALAWEHSSEEEIRRECRAQIEAALDLGVDVSHLDGHGGFQGSNPAGYARVCGRLAQEFSLPLRVQARRRYEEAGAAAQWDWLRAQGIRTSDACEDLGCRQAGESYAQFYLRRMSDLPAGLTDLYAHPCVDSDELRALAPDRAEARSHQYDLLMNVEWLQEALAQTGLRRASWRAIRGLQRRRPPARA